MMLRWHGVFLRLLFCLSCMLVSGGTWAADLPPASVPAPKALFVPSALPFFVRLGATASIQDTTLRAQIAGVPVAGGTGSIATVPAVSAEAGYYLTDTWAVSLSTGYPPTFALKGTGTLASFGTLYKAQVGLSVLAATYHLDLFGAFRPYAGLGVGYAIVFRNIAGTVVSPHLNDRAAFVLVGGFDYALNERWGVFVDVKKAFLKQHVSGLAAPFPGAPAVIPVSASVRTDPLLVTTGISYRF